MSELEQLVSIIDTILSNNNQNRQQSENLLRQSRELDLNNYIILFCKLLNATPRQEVQIFCISHIRRQISNYVDSVDTSLWHKLSAETQRFIKDFLFEKLTTEQHPKILSLYADLIGELGATIKTLKSETKALCSEEGKEWNELMQNVWSLLNSPNAALIQSALEIMAVLFSYGEKEYAKYKEELLPVFKQFLEYENLKVRNACIATLCAFLKNVDSKDCKPFADLLPLVFSNMIVFIEKDEDLAVDIFAELEELIDVEPKIFKKYVRELFDTIKAIVNHKDITVSALKDTGLKILTVLSQRSTVIYRDNPQMLRELFEIYFTHMITSAEEPDEQWITPPEGFIENDDNTDSSDSTIKFVMTLIDEVIRVLEEEQTLPLLSNLVLELVKVDDWRYHYAALMALSQVGEYIDNVEEFDPLVPLVLKFLESPFPKVRYAACHCIGMIASDMKGVFVSRFHPTVIPAIISMLQDKVPHVVGHALSALTNILENCSTEATRPYMEQVLTPCIKFLETGCSLVKENSLTTISTIAKITHKHFIPYWQDVAKLVFTLLSDATDARYKGIRGHCIECLTLMGLGIGEEEFSKAAHDVITKMVEIQQNDIIEADPQKYFLLAGWKRICQLLKSKFAPYLESIVPSLFNLIQTVLDEEKAKQKKRLENDHESTDVKEALGLDTVTPAGEKLFYTTNTSESQEMLVCVDMMNTFLKNLGKDYILYIPRTSDFLIYLIKNSINDEVRFAAAQTLPEIIRVIQNSDEEGKEGMVATMSRTYVSLLWNAQAEEVEAVNVSKIIQGMKEVISAGGRYMNEEEISIFSEKVVEALGKSDSRKADIREDMKQNFNDLDEEEAEIMEEENKNEEELQCALADLMGALFESHKELTLPLVQFVQKEILPKVFADGMSPIMNRFGIFLIDNMIEYLGLELIPDQWPVFTQILCQYATHRDGELRQAAVYGIGILAERAKENFSQVSDICLKALSGAIQIKRGELEPKLDYFHARDNAVASLGKVIKCQYNTINLKEVIQGWLGYLPLKHDKLEAKKMHELLVDIVLESDANLIFGEKGENLPKVIKIFAEVVDTQFVSEGFKEKMTKVCQLLANNEATRPMLFEAAGKLDGKLQEKLQRVLG